MTVMFDKFRFKAWVEPEPYVRYLMEKLYQSDDKLQNKSWFWKEPGHLYCYIFLSLFGHHVEPKYRCLIEAYQRCDLAGSMIAQEKLSTYLKRLDPELGSKFRSSLLVALILCGIERAGAKNPRPVNARSVLGDVILGELGASEADSLLLTDGRIKEALADARKEKSRYKANSKASTDDPSRCSAMSRAAATLFPKTFNKADKKALEKTKNGSMETLKAPMDPHSEWQRIAAGPHPLSIFETAWILVHFKLRDVHSVGF